MTLEEFKSLVKNRPEPEDPGYYSLTILLERNNDAQKGYSADEINHSSIKHRKEPFIAWRRSCVEHDYEKYATFEEAYQAMLTYEERTTVRNSVITGYKIDRIAFGPSHSSNCVSYRNYDARFHEISHSVHSLYHEDTLRIYGKYLGRFPEEIMFHPGDIVEVPVRLGDDDTAYYTLGIVMESPKTVEQMYRPNLDVFKDDITEIGDDYYRICFAPLGANDCIRFIPTGEVYPPAFGMPEEARTCLMQYRDEVQKVKDDIKNICRKKNPK
jgi:hypothetical protein